MRWRAVTCAALAATAVVCAVIAAAAPAPVPAAPSSEASSGASAGAALSSEASFHSVRSYADVAEPVRLRIPTLNVDAPLTHLGVAPDRTIEVPTDFAVPGWFDQGPRPGQPGPAVILGHVDSKAGPAVFYRLSRLPVGAEVLVDRADGSTATFRVRGTQHVAKTAFPTDLVYAPTLEPSLRLVTCGGAFDHARRSYVDNVIVYADP